MSIANPFLHDPDQRGEQERGNRLKRLAAVASVTMAVTLIVTKLVAYMWTGSVSLLSSLMDSTLDSLASIVTFISIKRAMEPADKAHRYGHGKLEAISAMAQAAFIVGSAVFLFYEALQRIVNPHVIEKVSLGYAVMLLSIVLTLALVMFQKYVIKKTGSVAIEGDHIHYKGDLLMNAGVVVAMFLSAKTGWLYFDPLFALGISVILLKSAKEVGTQAYDILMDRELPDEDRAKISEIVMKHPHAKSVHDLRTRSTGQQIFIELHLELDGKMTLDMAHHVTEEIEIMVYAAFPNAELIIHQEPAGIADDRLDTRVEDATAAEEAASGQG
ncbi:MAG: cation diffusion facilitator family transporter [Alphaproteobacteria bacterium]|nr:MAG: cation diffusion facilitator family transporter [Alphaproteobacteria bacterium]